jgi:hypothetical protein
MQAQSRPSRIGIVRPQEFGSPHAYVQGKQDHSEERLPEDQANISVRAHWKTSSGAKPEVPPHQQENVMKKITAISAILLASLAAVGSASAQDHAAKANIPFGFYVENKWVPAGTYTLTSDSTSPDVIAIRNGDSKISLLDVGRQQDQKPGSNALVFVKYGEKYFLHEIRCATCRMNVAFGASKQEKLAQTQEASVAPPSTVYLALNSK